MKAIFRNFIYVLKRFATSSLINFLGLTGAITVFLVCMIQVRYDYTYNHNIERGDDIVMAYLTETETGENSLLISTPLAQRIANSSAAVEKYTLIHHFTYPFKIDENLVEIELNKVKPDFLDLFQPEVLHGDARLGLEEGTHALITESEALRIFGKSNVVGEVIKPYFESNESVKESIYTIEAVVKDFPDNCSLNNGLYIYQEEFDYSEFSFVSCFLIKPEHVPSLQEAVNSKEFWGEEGEDYSKTTIHFISFTDYPQDAKFGNIRPRLISFFVVGVIVLLIAYINFINFSLTTAPSRIKSLNIHRVLGLSKRSQQWIMITESVLFTFFAFLLSLFLVSVLANSDLSVFFNASLVLPKNTSTLLACGLLLLLLSLAAGYYPAWYATSFKEIEALKGGSLNAVNSKKIREALLLFQLCIACTLPIVTGFIYLQYNYMLNYEWGLEKENIVYFKRIDEPFDTLINKLKENPAIIDYTSARFVPGNVQMGWGMDWRDKSISFKAWPVYPNFLTFFGIDIVEGENFPSAEDGTTRLIFNQKFVDTYASDKSPIGEEFPGFDSNLPICGIAENVNFESLHREIEPMAFVTLDFQNKGIIFLKIAKGAPLREVIAWIESVINDKVSGHVSVKFLEQKLDDLYAKENNEAKLITAFSIIILLITMMGVYGLVSFNVKYKEKEIALRKVNGATENQIVVMLNKSLLYIFGVAYIIAIPLSYWLSKKWIDQFAYRIEMHWWVFVLGGFLVLLITLLTVSIKSRHAALKDPIKSLKSE